MSGFPGGLAMIEFAPFLPMEGGRADSGDSWWTMDADAYWRGRATTSRLNHRKLQDWDGFMLAAMHEQTAIDFIDPIYRIPQAYRGSGLPGGFAGTGLLTDLTDPLNPVFSGLPVGLVLSRGDRIGIEGGGNKSCHLLTAGVTVASNTAQALPLLPPVLGNVFEIGATVRLLNPVLRLSVVPNSWRVPREARSEPVGTFEVVEASVT